MIYIAEEAFESSSDWQLAPHCVGTRTGLRGQTGRCTLPEFCDHLWSKTQLKDKNGQPALDANNQPIYDSQPKDTKWAKAAEDVGPQVKFSASQAATYVQGVSQNVPVLDANGQPVMVMGKEKTKAVKLMNTGPGYTGTYNVQNMMPGQANYYTAMDNAGNIGQRAKQQFDSVASSLSTDVQNSFKTVHGEMETASKITLEMRKADTNKALLDSNKGLKKYLGQPVKSKIQPSGVKSVNDYPVPDRDATIKATSAVFGDEATAGLKFDEAKAAFDRADNGMHAAAIRGVQNTYDTIKSANTPAGNSACKP